MASRRRTQEEKNLKTLRELASLPPNKQCFDCRQRGPTYINVTIGSFVCTSCSGILRGLNPPHRVKSITMTTFSLEEIEFIKSRGNEYCQYVWMGLYDSRAFEPESRDEQRTRDFMILKYERKRWYVDPDIAMKKMQQDHQRQSTLSSSSSQGNLVPETKPLSSLLGNSTTNLVIQNSQGNSSSAWPPAVTSSTAQNVSLPASAQTRAKGKIELINEFDGDAFNNSKSPAESLTANGNFANFESAFNTPALTTAQSNFRQRKACTPPAGWTSFDDDLDPLHSTSLPTSSSSYRQPSIPPPLSTKLPSTNSSAMPRPLSLPTFSPTNPFSSPSNKLSESSTPSQWPSFPVTTVAAINPAITDVIQTESITSGLPAHSSAPKVSVNSQMLMSQTIQPPSADKYAALADLDSLFHQNQPSVTSSSSWTTTESDIFGNNTTGRNDGVRNLTSDVASNPFSSESLGWNNPGNMQAQKIYSAANPFQTAISAPGVPVLPNSSFGTANATEDSFTGSAGFAAFPLNNMATSVNGIAPNQFGAQNGGFGIRPSVMMWGNQGTWGSGIANNQTIAQTSFQETKLQQTSSNWLQQNMPASANPFLDRNGSSVQRTNPSNPFL